MLHVAKGDYWNYNVIPNLKIEFVKYSYIKLIHINHITNMANINAL